MSALRAAVGLTRSLVLYHCIPLRARRLARFYAPFVAPGALCFDIGAHCGSRTRCWRRLGARVVAVEPQPLFVSVLRLLFGRDPEVIVEPVALGARAGNARLLVSERTPTVSTLSREWAEEVGRSPGFSGVRWEPGETVEMRTLDELVARHGTPTFVKIDVEGFEAEVLAGLSVALPSLSFEYLPAARAGAIACVERLDALAEYRFNWSRGESHRLVLDRWVDARGALHFLAGLDAGDRSGDVYARLGGV